MITRINKVDLKTCHGSRSTNFQTWTEIYFFLKTSLWRILQWPWELNTLQLKKTHANRQKTSTLGKSLYQFAHDLENKLQILTKLQAKRTFVFLLSNVGWQTTTSISRCIYRSYVSLGITSFLLSECAARFCNV